MFPPRSRTGSNVRLNNECWRIRNERQRLRVDVLQRRCHLQPRMSTGRWFSRSGDNSASSQSPSLHARGVSPRSDEKLHISHPLEGYGGAFLAARTTRSATRRTSGRKRASGNTDCSLHVAIETYTSV